MKKNRVIGLTGSIGSGKSVVADILRDLGAFIIDSDLLAREVVEPNSPGLKAVVKAFGPEVLTKTEELDRKALAAIVFNDPAKRKQLENILHPLIRERAKENLQKIELEQEGAVIVSVIPLLFESGMSYPELEKSVVVVAPKEECLARVMKRDGCSREFAEKRFAAQLDPDEKIRRADYIIENDGDITDLRRKSEELFKILKRA